MSKRFNTLSAVLLLHCLYALLSAVYALPRIERHRPPRTHVNHDLYEYAGTDDHGRRQKEKQNSLPMVLRFAVARWRSLDGSHSFLLRASLACSCSERRVHVAPALPACAAQVQSIRGGWFRKSSKSRESTDVASVDQANVDTVVQTMWNRHRTWATVARQQRRKLRRYRMAVLNLTVGGAALQTIAKQLPQSVGWVASIAGGGCVGLVPFVTSRCLGPQNIDAKTRSLAASKAIEAEVYLFRAGAAPYDGQDGTDPVKLLIDYCSNVSDDMNDLNVLFAMHQADEKPPPPRLDKRGYIDTRVIVETEHYRRLARRMARRVTVLRRCNSIAALSSGAIGLSAGGAFPQNLLPVLEGRIHPWGAVASTASAAIAAHIAAANWDEMSSRFLAKAKRLENLMLRLNTDAQPGSMEWNEFVGNCEEAIAGDLHKWDAVQSGV